MSDQIGSFVHCFAVCFVSGGVLAGLPFALKAVLSVFREVVGFGSVSGRGGEKYEESA